MDPFLLHAVAAEAADRLQEQEVHRVARVGPTVYLIRFSTASRDNLLVSVRPDLPRLHLLAREVRGRERRLAEEPPDRFAALLDQEIGGGVLVSLVKRPWDRVVELRFRVPDGGERRLIVELLGRSANLLLLAADGTIRGSARELRSAFRAPATGAVYAPPPDREEFADLPEGPAALPQIAARFGDAAAFLRRLSPLFAREEEQADVLRRVLEAQEARRWSPVVYSRGPLDFPEAGRDDLIAAPLPLLSLADRVATPFGSPSEAADVALGLLERARDFHGRREHHAAIVRKEVDRLSALIRKLEEEQARARDSDRFRRDGEALLAGLAAARVEGDAAVVPDPYDPGGPPRRVPIDPALPLPENARLLYERYKKGKRGLAFITTRLAAARQRLEAWEALAGPAREVRAPADLERLREAMATLGTVHAPPPAGRAARARPGRDTPARVRRHTSPDGLEILVGKSGGENDTLTFRVAAPHDFWLHAAGCPGAHVVVRNPRRLKTLPDATLRLAAEIAAFYSDARREGKVEVHYTQRKHVHKRRGMPPGQVILRRFRAIQVAPRIPAAPAGEI